MPHIPLPLTVFVVEIFNTTTGASLGFYPITTTDTDGCAALASELCTALNHGLDVGFTDWRQIAEHPYHPGRTDTVSPRSGV